jgi:hypothetical protein
MVISQLSADWPIASATALRTISDGYASITADVFRSIPYPRGGPAGRKVCDIQAQVLAEWRRRKHVKAVQQLGKAYRIDELIERSATVVGRASEKLAPIAH